MAQKLMNYTSMVSAERSIMGIEKKLAEAGASKVSKAYEDGRVTAIWFTIGVNDSEAPLTFRLPARVGIVESVLRERIKKPRKDTLKKIKDQAERTAWKILLNWTEAQLTLIQLQQAEAVEVFLPYLYDPIKDRTLFQFVKDSGYKMLQSGTKP